MDQFAILIFIVLFAAVAAYMYHQFRKDPPKL